MQLTVMLMRLVDNLHVAVATVPVVTVTVEVAVATVETAVAPVAAVACAGAGAAVSPKYVEPGKIRSRGPGRVSPPSPTLLSSPRSRRSGG